MSLICPDEKLTENLVGFRLSVVVSGEDCRMVEIEIVGTRKSQWGEGPLWWNDVLYYVDIEKHEVCMFSPETGEEKSWNVGQRVGFIAPRRRGGFIIGGDDGLFFFNEETGKTVPINDPEPDKADNRFNDGRCSPDGFLFAGTISLVKKTGDAKLYRLGSDLLVDEAFLDVTNSNGLAWSVDGETLFYIDTPRKEVIAFDYEDGLLRNERVVISTEHHEASPDGMTIDGEGNLWIAFCHGSCVACFDPGTGEEVKKIELPCMETTSCTFGGPYYSDLFVTTGIHKSEVEEDAGRLFRIRGLGVSGLPAHTFAG